MHQDRWQEIKEKILKEFEILNQSQARNEERREDIEIIEFIGPAGKMKVEWIARPKVLDKKTQYSRRIGSEVNVDYVYSENEATYTFKVYQWDNLQDDWQEIDSSALT